MRYRRALLLTDLEAGALGAISTLRRVAPELEHLLVVVRLPTPSFATLFGGEGSMEPGPAALEAIQLLQRDAAGAAPCSEVAVAPGIQPNALGDLASAAHVDLLVVASPSLRNATILVQLQQRLSVPLLWAGSNPAAEGPIQNVSCFTLGRRQRANLARFLRDHGAPGLRVTVHAAFPPAPDEAAALLEIAGIRAQVEVSKGRLVSLRSLLKQRPTEQAVDLLVFTRLPTPLLGLSWAAPLLLLPPPADAGLARERALDVADVVDDAGLIRARVDYAATVGPLSPVADQEIAFVCDGRVVATPRTSPAGEVELPAGLAMCSLGVVRVSAHTPPEALGGLEHPIAVVRPGKVPLLLFDAELSEDLVREVRALERSRGLQLMAIRLRPTRTARRIRERLRAQQVLAPVVDARAVLDEGPAFDVSEANDAVRLKRVAARLKRAGFLVAGQFHPGLAEPEPPPQARMQAISGNRVELELDNARARRWLLDAIASSKRSLHLQVYMAADDAVGRAVEAQLTAAAERGVTVRVLVDSLHGGHGSFGAENPILARLSSRRRVEVRITRPLRGLPSLTDLKLRDHQKLVVVDGQLALLGGRNLSSEYYTGFDEVELNAQAGWRSVPWLDAGARIEGPAVAALATAFLNAWTEAGGAPFEVPAPAASGATALSVVAHRGLADAHTLEAYLELIEGARSHIYAVNGFPFMLELQHALLAALRRGVTVRALTGHVTPTHAGQHFEGSWSTARVAATEFVHSRLDPLVEAGAQAYFFGQRELPGWSADLGTVHPHVHAKLMSVDGQRCSVGSANFDITSSYWESELTVVIEDALIAGALECELDRLFAGSTRWDPADPAWQELALRRAWMRRWPGVLAL